MLKCINCTRTKLLRSARRWSTKYIKFVLEWDIHGKPFLMSYPADKNFFYDTYELPLKKAGIYYNAVNTSAEHVGTHVFNNNKIQEQRFLEKRENEQLTLNF